MEDKLMKSVTRLHGKNFQIWKFQMRTLLIANGVYDITTGERSIPGNETENAAAKKEWLKDDAKAMLLISTSMEDALLESLLTCSTAKSMWETLSSIHEQKTESNKLILTQRFHEYRMDTSDSVVQHVAKVRNLASALKDVGETVSEVAVMAKILASLPSKFNALKTAWDSVSPPEQKLSSLIERLIKEETRLNMEDETNNASALAAVMTKTGRNRVANVGECSGQARFSKSNVECFYCKKMGHYIKNCRKKKRDLKAGEKNNNTKGYAFVAACSSSGVSYASGIPTARPSSAEMTSLSKQDLSDLWITDSGASRHITYRRDWLINFRSITEIPIVLGNNNVCHAMGIGTVLIEKLVNGKWSEGQIEDVLYIPKMGKNLFSVGVCTTKGYDVHFKDEFVNIVTGDTLVAQGLRQDNQIYRMFFRTKVINEANVSELSLKLWHERLAHLNSGSIKTMVKDSLIDGVKLSEMNDFFCQPCQKGKMHRLSFGERKSRKTHEPGEFTHSDVCGPMSVESLGGARFYALFKDDASGFHAVYFLKHKSDLFEKFKDFSALVKNRFGRPMKFLRVDNGREYCSKEMKRYLVSHGIQMESTAPYTPEQNGVAERDNRTIVEAARTMLHSRNLSLFLWAEAVNTAVYILNRTTCARTTGSTPYEMWTGRKPDLSHLRVFGSTAFMHIPKQFRKKLDAKAKQMVLVGYEGESANYRLFDPVRKTVAVSRDVTFDEQMTCSDQPEEKVLKFGAILPENTHENARENAQENVPENTQENAQENAQEILSISSDDDYEEAIDRNALSIGARAHGQSGQNLQSSAERQLRDRHTIKPPPRYQSNIAEIIIPDSFQEAVTGPDAQRWTQAISEELEAHECNSTWKLVPRKDAENLLDSKWVFKVQQDASGGISRYKARLCARGCKQKVGLDFTETFSPVVRYDSLRVLLAIVASKDLELVQFDVRTAFLYGELSENIFMKIPEGLPCDEASNEFVCKLEKSIYGLKQAPRCWNKKFSDFLRSFNLKQSDADHCIFTGSMEGSEVYLALFVDDGLIAAHSKQVINKLIAQMKENFDITLGDLSMFVGLQLERDRKNKTLFIHQRSYADKIIRRFRLENAKNISVPADPHSNLAVANNDECSELNVPFREAVGSLMFLAIVSRPDIAFAVNAVSRHLNKYTQAHWEAVKRIFRYVLGTKDSGIRYSHCDGELKLEGFSDADYASDLATRRSTTGYLFKLAGGPVSWESKRQRMVTLSTTEAEYVAAASAAKEAIWLRKLLSDIGCGCECPTVLNIDNQSAIRLVLNPEFHKRTKHIDIRCHYIREKVENSEITVRYVPSQLQKADVLTKALSREKFVSMRDMLGMCTCKEVLKQEVC